MLPSRNQKFNAKVAKDAQGAKEKKLITFASLASLATLAFNFLIQKTRTQLLRA